MKKQLYYKLYFLKNKFFPNKVYLAELENIRKRKKFYSGFLNPGDLVFDIGANMGNRVAAFVELKAQVIAVEPQPDCCLFMNERFGKKITILRKGAGDKEGMFDFYVADSNILSTFSQERIEQLSAGRFAEHKWEKSEKVEVITIDKMIKEFGLPDFIKIDVEGMELEVLKGLTKSVGAVSFEYTVPEEFARLKKCLEYLNILNSASRFNFSPGESMELGTNEWMDFNTMSEFIDTEKFLSTSWGDIYVRN